MFSVVKDLLAVRAGKLSDYILAILGGLFVGIIPGYIIQKFIELYPEYAPEGMRVAEELLTSPQDPGVASVIFLLCVTVPIIEEIIFRGILWRMLEVTFSTRIAFTLVSILFALAHGEIFHILGVLPVGIYIGWLRLRSKSIFPSILAHSVNNLMASISYLFN